MSTPVRNHRIDDIWYKQTSNISKGAIEPSIIVMHYTTGWEGKESRNWLLGSEGGMSNQKTSAHIIIDRDGSAWQIAPFNRRTWHAGPSKHKNLNDINSHSIGIEFQNPGWMKSDGRGNWVDCYGNRKSNQELDDFGGFILADHSRVGSGTFAWPLFTPKQIATGLDIVRILTDRYPIKSILTHEEIDTRGWKTDPGPAFQQQAFIDLVDSDFLESEPHLYAVSATRLNIRGGPGNRFALMDPPGYLPMGTKVMEIRREGSWSFVECRSIPTPIKGLVEGLRGWVHRSYLDLHI